MYGLTPFEGGEIWEPFRAFERDFFGRSDCRTDIRDDGDKYVLECEMPGFDKKDITVDVDENTLTLCAKHTSETDEKDGSGRYIRRERNYGSYCRSFDITDIDRKSIDASYNNGVLRLTLPKKEKGKAEVKHIQIN